MTLDVPTPAMLRRLDAQYRRRAGRDAHAAISGDRAGRMLSVTAARLPGPASSYVLVGTALLVVLAVVVTRRALAGVGPQFGRAAVGGTLAPSDL